MTKEDLKEVMELAKNVAKQNPKKTALDRYVDGLEAEQKREEADKQRLAEYYGLNDEE